MTVEPTSPSTVRSVPPESTNVILTMTEWLDVFGCDDARQDKIRRVAGRAAPSIGWRRMMPVREV
jgi:hypothetical protein